MTTEKTTQDVYQQITDRVVAAIEAGAPTFEMPWHRGAEHPRPRNVVTGKSYRGVNILALWITQSLCDYSSSVWGTYKQWKACGAQVRKGEQATTIVFYKDLEREVEDEATGETKLKKSFVATASWVFNADQVDNWTAPQAAPLIDKTEVLDNAEAFIAATGANILSLDDSAYYLYYTDTINIPKRALFTGSSTRSATEAFYSTTLHELTHWSGHPNRLNRQLNNRFGDCAYAMEELVAELGAAFLCTDLGIALEPRPDHAAYLSGWLTVLKQDKRALFTAAARASEAADFLHKFQPHTISQEAA